jgi:hypothetical protein
VSQGYDRRRIEEYEKNLRSKVGFERLECAIEKLCYELEGGPDLLRSNYLGAVKGRDPWGSMFAVGSVTRPASAATTPAATTNLAAVLDRRSSSHDQADDEQNQEDDEQDPCDLSGRACDTAQAQDPGNQRDYQKSDRPV